MTKARLLADLIDASGDVKVANLDNLTISTSKYTATANQTDFSHSYTAGKVWVFVNGVRLPESDFTATDGSTVTLTSAAQVDDEVVISNMGN